MTNEQAQQAAEWLERGWTVSSGPIAAQAIFLDARKEDRLLTLIVRPNGTIMTQTERQLA